MMNLPFAGTGEHRPQLPSRPLSKGGENECRGVQIRLDTRCGGVIRSSELKRWGGVVIPLVIERSKRGTLRDHATFREVVGL